MERELVLQKENQRQVQESEVLLLKEIYANVVPKFTIHHARVYASLLSGSLKDARRIAEETAVWKEKIYGFLNELLEMGLISKTNTTPALYFTERPAEVLDRKIKKQQRLLLRKRQELRELINGSNGNKEPKGEYLISMNGGQTRLIDRMTKQPIMDSEKIKVIQRQLERAMKE